MPQIDLMRIEIREDGIYVLQNTSEKLIERKVTHNYRVLYRDAEGKLHFGYVRRCDEQKQQYIIQENVLYPNAPSLQAPDEIIPWSAVVAAAGGYSYKRAVVYDATGRKMGGLRYISMIWEGNDIGFITRRQASSLYVVHKDGRWIVRS